MLKVSKLVATVSNPNIHSNQLICAMLDFEVSKDISGDCSPLTSILKDFIQMAKT